MGKLYPDMNTLKKMIDRIEKQEQSIKIVEMLPFDEMRSMLDQRLKLRGKTEKLRAILND